MCASLAVSKDQMLGKHYRKTENKPGIAAVCISGCRNCGKGAPSLNGADAEYGASSENAQARDGSDIRNAYNASKSELSRQKTLARYREIVRLCAMGILGNLLLAAMKAVVGFAAGSIAVVLDALNSLTDVSSSVATIIGEKITSMRPTRKYPYGYGRVEYLTAILIAVIILAAGALSIFASIQRLVHPEEPDFSIVTLAVLLVATAVKVIMGTIFIRRGRAGKSQPLHASGVDALYDAVLTFGTFASAVICLIWGVDIDGWVGLVISLFVIKAGLGIVRKALGSIIGTRPDEDTVRRIRAVIAEHEGVMGVYDLMIDSFGPEFLWAAAHIEVPESMTAFEIHELTRHISEDLSNECNARAILGVYASNSTGDYAGMHKKLKEIIDHHPEILGIHGFYVDKRAKHVDFDMVIDFKHNADSIRDHIVTEMMEVYPDYEFDVITDINYSD